MTDTEKIALYEERLEIIDTALMGKATTDVSEYSVNGREIKKHSINELINLQKYFQSKLTSLQNKTRPRKILTRFV